MTVLLSEGDVRATLDMATALDAVEESFRRQAAGDARAQPRRRLELPDRVFFNYMAAADRQGGWMGAKLYTVAHGRAGFVVLLYRATTGELAAILEADWLGRMRTGAATGIATKYMARADARTAGIIGTGGQARTQLEAVTRVRKIESVRAFGRDPSRRADFCREMTGRLAVPVTPASSAEEVVRGADIVITATNAATPVVSGAWLAPGSHLNAIGSNLPQRRELDDDAIARAAVVAVDSIEQSKMESGELIHAFGADPARWDRVTEVAEIVSGKRPGRTSAHEITLFKSNGIATWDIAVAARVLERAAKEGLGRRIELGGAG
jgi:alanine dehydrogenase